MKSWILLTLFICSAGHAQTRTVKKRVLRRPAQVMPSASGTSVNTNTSPAVAPSSAAAPRAASPETSYPVEPAEEPSAATMAPARLAPAPGTPGSRRYATPAPSTYMIDQGIGKYLVILDYNSWFEKLTVVPATGLKQESQALFYGYGLNFEKNWYQPSWGWGLGGALMYGRAIGGDKNGTQNYFEARQPWYAMRVTPRIFYRWNPQADFGMNLAGMYKQSSWPDKTGDSIVKSGSDMLAGVFFDVRVRFNIKLELVQSFGILYNDESIFWRLGVGYRL